MLRIYSGKNWELMAEVSAGTFSQEGAIARVPPPAAPWRCWPLQCGSVPRESVVMSSGHAAWSTRVLAI